MISSTNGSLDIIIIFFSFCHEHLKNQAALSKQFWSFKHKGLTPEIQWTIMKKSNTPKCFDSWCNLCLEEKIHIMIYPDSEKIIKSAMWINS